MATARRRYPTARQAAWRGGDTPRAPRRASAPGIATARPAAATAHSAITAGLRHAGRDYRRRQHRHDLRGEAIVGDVGLARVARVGDEQAIEPVVAVRRRGDSLKRVVVASSRVPRGQRHLQLLLAAQHVRLHRADGTSEYVGGFLVGQVVMVALHDRGPLRLGQRGHGALEVHLERGTSSVIGVHVVDVRHVRVVLVSDRVQPIAQELFLALARVGEPAVGGDAIEPGREAGFLPERLQVAPREHEGLLRQVVGQRMVAGGQLAQARAHARLVALDELGERVAVVCRPARAQ